MTDADRVTAHRHVSGDHRFGAGQDGDMADITSPNLNLIRQKSSVLIAPDGSAARLPIPRSWHAGRSET